MFLVCVKKEEKCLIHVFIETFQKFHPHAGFKVINLNELLKHCTS